MTPPSLEQSLFVQWEKTLGDLLDRTRRFPKSARFTFASRIDNAALDVLEELVEARYLKGRAKGEALARVDRRLTRLRVLLRVSHDRALLDHRAYEHVSRAVDEAGRMVGGWRRQQAEQAERAARKARTAPADR